MKGPILFLGHYTYIHARAHATHIFINIYIRARARACVCVCVTKWTKSLEAKIIADYFSSFYFYVKNENERNNFLDFDKRYQNHNSEQHLRGLSYWSNISNNVIIILAVPESSKLNHKVHSTLVRLGSGWLTNGLELYPVSLQTDFTQLFANYKIYEKL